MDVSNIINMYFCILTICVVIYDKIDFCVVTNLSNFVLRF